MIKPTEEVKLTIEEQAQLFLMDFENALFKRCSECGQLKKQNWMPNEWGVKLVEFIQPIIEKQVREEIADWLLKQGAVWVDKNYSIIEAIRSGKL